MSGPAQESKVQTVPSHSPSLVPQSSSLTKPQPSVADIAAHIGSLRSVNLSERIAEAPLRVGVIKLTSKSAEDLDSALNAEHWEHFSFSKEKDHESGATIYRTPNIHVTGFFSLRVWTASNSNQYYIEQISFNDPRIDYLWLVYIASAAEFKIHKLALERIIVKFLEENNDPQKKLVLMCPEELPLSELENGSECEFFKRNAKQSKAFTINTSYVKPSYQYFHVLEEFHTLAFTYKGSPIVASARRERKPKKVLEVKAHIPEDADSSTEQTGAKLASGLGLASPSSPMPLPAPQPVLNAPPAAKLALLGTGGRPRKLFQIPRNANWKSIIFSQFFYIALMATVITLWQLKVVGVLFTAISLPAIFSIDVATSIMLFRLGRIVPGVQGGVIPPSVGYSASKATLALGGAGPNLTSSPTKVVTVDNGQTKPLAVAKIPAKVAISGQTSTPRVG